MATKDSKKKSNAKKTNAKKTKPKTVDPDKLVVRNWREEDIPKLVELHHLCYKDTPVKMLDDERLYEMQFSAFPDGLFLVEVGVQHLLCFTHKLSRVQ